MARRSRWIVSSSPVSFPGSATTTKRSAPTRAASVVARAADYVSATRSQEWSRSLLCVGSLFIQCSYCMTTQYLIRGWLQLQSIFVIVEVNCLFHYVLKFKSDVFRSRFWRLNTQWPSERHRKRNFSLQRISVPATSGTFNRSRFLSTKMWHFLYVAGGGLKACSDLPGPGLSITNTDIVNKTCTEMAANYPRICAPDFWGGRGKACCRTCKNVDGKLESYCTFLCHAVA